ncbi:MAG: hypothetical protein ABSH32_00940 [Bryobacteraceae bacterium]|jgi:uncharacterized protein (TIGR03437 family)
MISQFRKTQYIATAAALIACFGASARLAAQSPATTKAVNVFYTAAGTFASTPVSGLDKLEMAGTPFTITVWALTSTVPKQHGAHAAQYTNLKMQGTVSPCFLGCIPITIQSEYASIELATGNSEYDEVSVFVPVSVNGIQINISTSIQMPKGTLTTPLIRPFTAPVTLSSTTDVTYMDPAPPYGPASTTLAIGSGTLSTCVSGQTGCPPPGAGPKQGAASSAPVVLHAGSARAVTAHGDGTTSVRSISGASVDLGSSTDMVMLEFYASGVRDASDVRVQIAGHDVPVRYTGASGYFPGLDEVTVQVPRSLAGTGDADVVLAVDGRAADPVRIHIQ